MCVDYTVYAVHSDTRESAANANGLKTGVHVKEAKGECAIIFCTHRVKAFFPLPTCVYSDPVGSEMSQTSLRLHTKDDDGRHL